MKRVLISFMLLAAVLFAASAPTQMGVTSKQVAFRYHRSDTTPCTWEVSEDPSYSPVVAELSSGGADGGEVGERWFVVGGTTPLTSGKAHYWRETCGSEVYTGTFTTLAAGSSGTTQFNTIFGGHPYANRLTFEYGTTPALGSSVDATCSPGCPVQVTVSYDSLLFYRHIYKNETDTVGTGNLQLMVLRPGP